MIRSKKGDVNFIVAILLVIISFFVIGGVLYFTMAEANAKETEIMCKNSIDFRARTQFNLKGDYIGGEIKAIPVLCKTIERKISGTREEILEQVAYSMSRCWWMFGEGRYDEILKGSNVKLFPKVFGLEELNNQCFNCYTLLIDQDEIEGGPIGPEEIMKFMNYHNHPQFQNLTYLEYIQSYGGPGMAVFTAPVIMPRGAYSISFTPKNKEASPVWSAITKVAIGTVVAIVVVGAVALVIASAGTATPIVATAAGAAASASGGAAAAAAGTTAAVAGGTAAGTTAATVGATVGGYTMVSSGLWIPSALVAETAVGAVATTAAPIAATTAASTGITLAGIKTAATVGALATGTLTADAYMMASGVTELLTHIYGEREISAVIFGYLEAGQKFCGSGEISGD